MKRFVGIALAGALAFGVLAGCKKEERCHPGDVRAGHGHVEKCGTDRRWHL